MLFLSHLESIGWQIGASEFGEVLRVKHSEIHFFEVLKQAGGKTSTSSHYLKFDQPVEGLEKQRVAVAFALDFLPNIARFSAAIPLAKQLKVIPASPGKVAVFFPAEKEVSNLRFHLHAPFVPELSRATIKETPANHPLFRQLAEVCAASLHQIRKLGLLTTEFLSVLPHPNDQIPPRYEGIRLGIVDEMNTKPLTPTYGRSHAPAARLLQSKRELKELLSKEDIEFLVDYDDEPPLWAMAAGQRNSDADRFLESLAITKWDSDEFIKLVIQQATEGVRHIPVPPYVISGPDNDFAAWLSDKPAEWHQRLYSFLFSELGPSGGCWRLKGLKIVRLGTGKYSVGTKCFFPGDGGHDDEALPRVSTDVYTSGKSKAQQDAAKKLLNEIGVREVGEAEQVEAILKQRYTAAKFKPRTQDLKRFVALVEQDPSMARLFSDYFIFLGKSDKWIKPSGIYLDHPFIDTGLAAYYDALETAATCIPLAGSYQNCGIAAKRLVKFAQSVGAHTALAVQRRSSVGGHPLESHLRSDWYSPSVRRTSSEINEDWDIQSLTTLLA